MALISVTRLRLRSIRYLLPFAWYSLVAARQARTAPGNRGVSLRRTRGMTFWTLTVWEGGTDMLGFRNRSPHRKAMSRLADWCDEASVARWEQSSDEMPGWDGAARKLLELGHLSRVAHPSQDQRDGRIRIT